MLFLKIWEDLLSPPNAMGTMTVRIPSSNNEDTTQWYDVPPDSAKNASGKIQVRLQTTIFRSRAFKIRGNAFEFQFGIPQASSRSSMGRMVQGKDVNLDVSCVAILRGDQVPLQDTVYSMRRPPFPMESLVAIDTQIQFTLDIPTKHDRCTRGDRRVVSQQHWEFVFSDSRQIEL
jgi:hypothetical protein